MVAKNITIVIMQKEAAPGVGDRVRHDVEKHWWRFHIIMLSRLAIIGKLGIYIPGGILNGYSIS